MSAKVAKILATGCGIGFVPYAPGTAGTILGIPIFLALVDLQWTLYLLTILAFTILSVYIAGIAEMNLKKKDAPPIIIDEITGFLWTMFLVSPDFFNITAGFLIFRFFDIVKPFPIRRIQKALPGGWGIVMDDVAAGIYACTSLHLITKLWGAS
ncbi:MAG: phosphatidylglycerophosphatase A [Syntrophales bacterium]|nr:phosphatidylglycerophosphatase A [Syntrophales bacterium]